MDNFLNEWKWGYVEHLPVGWQSLDLVIETLTCAGHTPFLLCDADDKSAAFLEQIIKRLSQKEGSYVRINLLGELAETQKISTQIDHMPEDIAGTVNTIHDSQSAIVIIEALARNTTLKALHCTDLIDYSYWISSGSVFIATGVDEVAEGKLCSQIQKHYSTYHNINGTTYITTGVACVISCLTIGEWGDGLNTISELCPEGTLVIGDKNFYPVSDNPDLCHPLGFRLFMALEESEKVIKKKAI